jgi:hypothetical protein
MRQETIRLKTYNGAKRRAPWAAVIARIYGGFIAFESVDDFIRWKSQQ